MIAELMTGLLSFMMKKDTSEKERTSAFMMQNFMSVFMSVENKFIPEKRKCDMVPDRSGAQCDTTAKRRKQISKFFKNSLGTFSE